MKTTAAISSLLIIATTSGALAQTNVPTPPASVSTTNTFKPYVPDPQAARDGLQAAVVLREQRIAALKRQEDKLREQEAARQQRHALAQSVNYSAAAVRNSMNYEREFRAQLANLRHQSAKLELELLDLRTRYQIPATNRNYGASGARTQKAKAKK